jgi:hypothetical protein
LGEVDDGVRLCTVVAPNERLGDSAVTIRATSRVSAQRLALAVLFNYQDGAWRNRVEGSGTTALSFATQEEAVEVGRKDAERAESEHVIRDQAGNIAATVSYASSTEPGPGN